MDCPRCQTENPSDATRCTRCGAVLARAESELRAATVLFADIRGFTSLSEKLSPEQVTQIINECFTLLAGEIEKVGGVIDKFMGDAVMALFGAPRAHENDAERAIMAALGMLQQLGQFSARLEQRMGQTLQMRIGINTGPVVAGWIGSPSARSYTVMGDTVNLASRLEHGGRPGAIWVHETTYHQARYAFEFEAVGLVQVKGKSAPVQVYEVKGRKAQRERRRGLPGLYAPMLGRQVELAQVMKEFEHALQGECRLVELVGEAGIGKSRLLAEFESVLQREGRLEQITYLKGRSLPYNRLNTYGLVREMLGRFLSQGGEPESGDIWAAAGQDAPLIGRLFGIAIDGAQWEALAPEDLQREIHRAVGRLLAQTAASRPLILACEDMHWADPASLKLLRDVLPLLAKQRVLVCSLRRPEAGELDLSTLSRQTIHISPLVEAQSYELIGHVLGTAELPDQLKRSIVRKASGNPFYVEELLKSLIESGMIAQRNGSWQLADSRADIRVPDTVRDVTMTRIDALPLETRRVLELAAIIGPTFRAWLVSAIADAPNQVAAHLDALAEADLIVATGKGEFRFKHLLGQEVAYNNMLVARRRELHRAVAAAMEKQYADRIESQLDALAFHYEHGGLWPRALEYRQKAGQWAQRIYANAQAAEHLTRALDIIAQWEHGPSSLLEDEAAYPAVKAGFFSAQRAVALTARGEVHALIGKYQEALADYQQALDYGGTAKVRADRFWHIGAVHEKQGRYEEALRALEAGHALVQERHRSHTLPRLLTTLGWVYVRQGQLDLAEQTAQQALSVVNEKHAPREAALAYKALGYVAYSQGNWALAAGHWQHSLALVERTGDRREAGRLLSNLGLIAARHAQFDEAIAYFTRGLESLEHVGDVEAIATVYNNLGGACARAGRYNQAHEYYLKSLQSHQAVGHALEAARCQSNLGELACKIGNLQEAIDYLTCSRDSLEKLGAAESLPEVHRQLAAAYLAAHNLSTAYQHGEQAFEYARKTGNRLEEAITHRILGQVAGAQGEPLQANEHLQASCAILEELGSQDELAQTLVALAELHTSLGDPAQAHTRLEQAIEIFERLGDHVEAERVKAKLAQAGKN